MKTVKDVIREHRETLINTLMLAEDAGFSQRAIDDIRTELSEMESYLEQKQKPTASVPLSVVLDLLKKYYEGFVGVEQQDQQVVRVVLSKLYEDVSNLKRR